MYRKIKIAVALFFTIIMILSSIAIIDYQNSGNVNIQYINEPEKRYTSGLISNTVALFQNSIMNGTFSNYAPPKESHDMVYDSQNGYIYLSGYSPDFIYIINPINNSIVGFISGVSSPRDIVYDKFNHDIYVADYSTKQVSIINTQSNKVVKNIHVSGYPVALSYDNINKELYVTQMRCYYAPYSMSSNITIINTLTDKTIKNIDLGRCPDNMYFYKNGSLLFVSNRVTNNIIVINTISNKIVNNIKLNPETNPENIVLNSNTGLLNVLTGYGNIVSINPITFKITGDTNTTEDASAEVYDLTNNNSYLFDNNQNKISILHDGGLIMNITGVTGPVSGLFIKKLDDIYIVSSASTYIYVLNVTNSVITNKILTRDHPEELAYDFHTKNIYVTNQYGNNVLIMNKNEKIIDTIKVGKSPDGIVFDNSNNYLYVANTGSRDISVINASNNNVVNTISIASNPTKLLLNPADNHLYISGYNSKNITVLNANDDQIMKTISLKGNIIGFTLDTKNNNIYVTTTSYNAKLYVINSNNKIVYYTANYSYNPYCILYDRADNLIYFTNINYGEMCVFNPSTDKFVTSFSFSTCPSSQMVLDTYNNFLYVISQNTMVSVNTTSDHYVKCIEMGSPGTSSMYIRSMNSVYIASSASGTIQKLNTISYNVTIVFNNIGFKERHCVRFDHKSFPHRFTKECTVAINNGTYTYDIIPAYHRNVRHPEGSVKISGDNVIINVEYRNYYRMDVYLTELIFISAGFVMGTLYVYYYVKGKNQKV